MFQYLIKIKYENREIPNSLWGSLSCLGFSRIARRKANEIWYAWMTMYNIPNWKFGMLHGSPVIWKFRWAAIEPISSILSWIIQHVEFAFLPHASQILWSGGQAVLGGQQWAPTPWPKNAILKTCNFSNANKIAIKSKLKQNFDFNIFPPIFHLFWRSRIISSHIF